MSLAIVYHFDKYQTTVALSTHDGWFVPKGRRSREGAYWAYCCGTIAGASRESVEELYGELERSLVPDSQ